MELKSYVSALIALFMCVRQCSSCREYDCDHPGIPLGDDLRVYNAVPGFIHPNVTVIYDVVFNRTLFISVVIVRDMVQNLTVNGSYMFGCSIDYSIAYAMPFPDNPGIIIPLRLGGSCHTFNTYSVNEACIPSIELFEKWTLDDISKYGDLKYCVKLTYPDYFENIRESSLENRPDDDFRMPDRVTINIFTHPKNDDVREMVMNNNQRSSDCKNIIADSD